MKDPIVNNISDVFYSFCTVNNLDFKKDKVGRIVFDSSAYIKFKNHPRVLIKHIRKGGLIVGGSDQKGQIIVGYERNEELVILLELENQQFISSGIAAQSHVRRAKKINNEEVSESPASFIVPSNCPKIELDNTKLSLIILSKTGNRLFFGKLPTVERINEILKLEKDIYYRRLGFRVFFIMVLVFILFKFLDFV